jgi:D-galactarolactone cycloisomerase
MTELSKHRIDRVEHLSFERHYPRHTGYNSHGGPHGKDQTVRACKIFTDQGASGWGFCYVTVEDAQRWVGQNLAELYDERLGTRLDARPLDIPLHDLVGKISNRPVWRMLGERGAQAERASIPIYDGSILFDDLNPDGEAPGVEALLENCRSSQAAGYAHFKLKIGRGFRYMERAAGDARDIEVTQRVREHFPQAKILVDANDGYSVDGFVRYLEAVAECNLYWVEEPFQETEEGLRTLRNALEHLSPRTLVADAESRNDRLQDPLGPFGKWQAEHLEELYELCRRGLLDVLLMDVGAMGFSAWRRVLPLLLELGVQGSPHAWGEPFKSYFAAQLGCGLGGVPIVEGVPGHVDGVDDSEYVLKDGWLTLPNSPGFGLNLE